MMMMMMTKIKRGRGFVHSVIALVQQHLGFDMKKY